ncbi:unnamed protein product, partial [Phaeothamnion confervicola]
QGQTILHNNTINKELGTLWKATSAEDRSAYEAMATKDKLRYLREMKEYKPVEGYRREVPRINAPKTANGAGAASVPLCRPAYSLFASQERRGVLESSSRPARARMSKIFGQRWHHLNPAEAQLYAELEEVDFLRYEEGA